MSPWTSTYDRCRKSSRCHEDDEEEDRERRRRLPRRLVYRTQRTRLKVRPQTPINHIVADTASFLSLAGNARAVAEAERQAAAAREQSIDDMERMLAEDQAA